MSKIILCGINELLVAEWKKLFNYDNVSVVKGSIFEQGADAIVAPGNSYGFMDGGLDLKISEFFDYKIAPKVKRIIRDRPGGKLDVGDALFVETEDTRIPYLIYAPTMVRPQSILGTDNTYRAMKAAMGCINLNYGKLQKVAVPGLGIGCGEMPPETAAKQMFKAFIEVGLK